MFPLYYGFCRLGAPDFYPQTLSCAEETLTKEYVQSGYKDTVEGIEVCSRNQKFQILSLFCDTAYLGLILFHILFVSFSRVSCH